MLRIGDCEPVGVTVRLARRTQADALCLARTKPRSLLSRVRIISWTDESEQVTSNSWRSRNDCIASEWTPRKTFAPTPPVSVTVRVFCSGTTLISPSSVSAEISRQSGSVSRRTRSEWYRVAWNGLGTPRKIVT